MNTKLLDLLTNLATLIVVWLVALLLFWARSKAITFAWNELAPPLYNLPTIRLADGAIVALFYSMAKLMLSKDSFNSKVEPVDRWIQVIGSFGTVGILILGVYAVKWVGGVQ